MGGSVNLIRSNEIVVDKWVHKKSLSDIENIKQGFLIITFIPRFNKLKLTSQTNDNMDSLRILTPRIMILIINPIILKIHLMGYMHKATR